MATNSNIAYTTSTPDSVLATHFFKKHGRDYVTEGINRKWQKIYRLAASGRLDGMKYVA